MRYVAQKIYNKEVRSTEYQEKFAQELMEKKVVDQRKNGYYCYHCDTFSKDYCAGLNEKRVIYPREKNEIWIVNTHHDFCLERDCWINSHDQNKN